jgi:hypothetical protein
MEGWGFFERGPLPAPDACRGFGKDQASTLPPTGAACIHRPMRMPLLLVPLLLLALPWNSCTRGKARLSDNGPSQLRNGAGFFNPKTEVKAASTSKQAFDE